MTNEELKTLRRNAGLSVAVLSKLTTLTRREIMRYESGQCTIPDTAEQKLYRALPVNAILTGSVNGDRGSRVRELRESLGHTQSSFADMTGISQSNISRIEAGSHELQSKTAIRIAEKTSADLCYLLFGARCRSRLPGSYTRVNK